MLEALYELRTQFSPWAQALLALSLESLSPGDARAATLISDLQASALRSGSGASWDTSEPDPQNMVTPVFVTAVVVYALAQREPASALLPDAVRYLMAHRSAQGTWASSYELGLDADGFG